MGLFERYLSVWVGLGILAGVGLGLFALLDLKRKLPALGQLAAQVRQAGRVGFVLQGQLKRAALLTD